MTGVSANANLQLKEGPPKAPSQQLSSQIKCSKITPIFITYLRKVQLIHSPSIANDVGMALNLNKHPNILI